MTAPTRRERLRTATLSEIKDGARRLLVTGGPDAISLRAIARDMGMTAAAIYRYFPSLEALVGTLAGDLFEELTERLRTVRDGAGTDPVDQLTVMARALRTWSVEHPAEFGLIFGPPAPGLTAFVESCAAPDHPGARFGAVFVEPLVDLWRNAPFATPPIELLDRHLRGRLEPLRLSHGEVPIEVAWIFLVGSARIWGLVAMEVFHQLDWAITEPEQLFELELASFTSQLRTPRPQHDHELSAGETLE